MLLTAAYIWNQKLYDRNKLVDWIFNHYIEKYNSGQLFNIIKSITGFEKINNRPYIHNMSDDIIRLKLS